MALYATENDIPIGLFQSMDPAAILLVPVVVVVTAVVIFLHHLVLKFLSTAMVRNKVVVITDALTGLGKGKSFVLILKTKLRYEVHIENCYYIVTKTAFCL